MSRNFKRVPMSFDCAHGYDRAGGRSDANAALFSAQWEGNNIFV